MTPGFAPVCVVLEGSTDVPVAERLLEHVGLTLGAVYGLHGKAQNDEKLPAYNNAARFSPWFVLRDLDNDAACAPELLAALLPSTAPQMCFRVAVRKMESWLLADPRALSAFLRVPIAQIPTNPDDLTDPKAELVRLARRSRKPSIRRDMVPRVGSGASVGPGYAGRITEFARDRWQPGIAARRSPSLAGCIRALERWTHQ